VGAVVVKVHSATIEIDPRGRGLIDITDEVARIVAASGVVVGLASVFIQHTSASLVISENADPAVLRDLGTWLARLAPEDPHAYEHDDEGPDDMPAHLRAAITKTSETIPIRGGRLALGTWQAIYLWEHRVRPTKRTMLVSVLGGH
jgi:secondary thiamine-phosphate synthase enzyme